MFCMCSTAMIETESLYSTVRESFTVKTVKQLNDIALLNQSSQSYGMSHSVTCHPTQVNTTCLTPARQADTWVTYPGGMKGWVDLGGWDSIPVTRRSSNRTRWRATTYSPQPGSRRSKNEFCTKQSPWTFTTQYLTSWKSAASVSPYHSRPVAFWSLLAYEQLQGPHHQRHIRMSVRSVDWHHTPWSICQSHPTQLTVGQPGCGRRLPQPGR